MNYSDNITRLMLLLISLGGAIAFFWGGCTNEPSHEFNLKIEVNSQWR